MGNSKCSMVEIMKICISVANMNMREAGAGSRMKTHSRSQSLDNEWTWAIVKSLESKDKWLVSDTAETVNA